MRTTADIQCTSTASVCRVQRPGVYQRRGPEQTVAHQGGADEPGNM